MGLSLLSRSGERGVLGSCGQSGPMTYSGTITSVLLLLLERSWFSDLVLPSDSKPLFLPSKDKRGLTELLLDLCDAVSSSPLLYVSSAVLVLYRLLLCESSTVSRLFFFGTKLSAGVSRGDFSAPELHSSTSMGSFCWGDMSPSGSLLRGRAAITSTFLGSIWSCFRLPSEDLRPPRLDSDLYPSEAQIAACFILICSSTSRSRAIRGESRPVLLSSMSSIRARLCGLRLPSSSTLSPSSSCWIIFNS